MVDDVMDDDALPRRRSGLTLAVAVVVVVALLIGAVSTIVAFRPRQDGTPAPAPAPLEAGPGQPVPFKQRVAADVEAPLPDRVLPGFAGAGPVDLAGYRGRPLVVNFWATWCAPCVEEMPALDQVAGEVADEVAFLGVDVADPPRLAEPFVAELGIGYDLAVDVDRELALEVGVATMPTTLFVDPGGTIVHRAYGALDAADLRAAMADHLGVRG